MLGSHSLRVSGAFEVVESSLPCFCPRRAHQLLLFLSSEVCTSCVTLSVAAWSPALSKERRERPQDRPEDLDVPPALADFIHQQRTQQVEQDM